MITVQKLIEINKNLIDTYGGLGFGIRDNNLLESCIASLDQEVFGRKLYPSPEDKIAFVVFSVIANHIFIDGNKRTGAQVLDILADYYKLNLHFTDDELIDLVLLVAKSEVDYSYIKNWIEIHKRISGLHWFGKR